MVCDMAPKINPVGTARCAAHSAGKARRESSLEGGSSCDAREKSSGQDWPDFHEAQSSKSR